MRLILWFSFLLFFGTVCQANNDSLHQDEGAYYNYRNWECEIKNNKALLRGQIKITILNPKGDSYNHIGFNESEFSKLKECQIKLIDSSGSVLSEIGKKKLNKSCGFGSSFQLYDDICYYYAEPVSPKYPYSIEYEFTKEIKTLFFWRGVQFQLSLPVVSSSYKLTCPEDFGFQFKLYGTDSILTQTSHKGNIVYVWELQDIPATEEIKYVIDGDPEPISLSFIADKFNMAGYKFEYSTWANIGQWYNNLARDCYLKHIDTAEPKSSNPDSIAKALYDKIIDDTRYVSISIDIGGWKPNATEDVLNRGYGDCKDLTTLLISQLRANGIEAYPCLALTRGDGKLDEDFPNFGFNHVFTMAIIDGDSLLMDPTCTQCPYGTLPKMDNNIPILVVTDSTAFLTRTPQTTPEERKTSINSLVKIDKDGYAIVELTKSYYGNYAHSKRAYLQHLDKDETEASIYNILPGGRKKYRVMRHEILNLENREKPVIIKLTAKRKKKLDQFKGTLYLQPSILESEIIYNTVDTVDRDVPVNLGIPWQNEHHIEIIPDTSLKIDSIHVPSNDSVVYNFAEIHCSYEKLADRILINTMKKSNQYSLPKSEFADYKQFRKKSRELLLNSIKVFTN